ncbi:MAG TPA: phosphoribosylformylglycinamidine synthase subunit PurL [Firmicutes bacterium]|nr:phosphoribosylformylglycinamidine synthase subunit PurL [Candidatus Fermentithermobacillaceae bacterium]
MAECVTPKDPAPLWRQMGLKDEEYSMIVEKLGREPNYTELGMFAVLWSEHCAYKHSKSLLRTLPTKGERVMVGPGENAGVVDIGDGLACAFKVESHNHPCAVEPYQGAATGIGGIVRDILAMGARPVALLDSLRFGHLDDARTRFLFGGVVSGIAGYGNCLGIPTVGGEVYFQAPYRQNPLVNVLCAGIMDHKDLHKGQAYGVGNVVMIVGHSTGRDGIHGCTFASEELGEDTESKRPNVQVGDPFMEKLLIEACLEMMQKGAVVGIQDMGAAGITSSCAETAARAGTGLAIEVSKVPMREEGMTAYDVMLSESQERMLLIVKPEKVEEVKAIGKKWGLNAAEIGQVTSSGQLQVFHNGKLEASIPVNLLAEGSPVYNPEWKEPAYFSENQRFDYSAVKVPELKQFGEILLKLLAAPNIASKEPVFRQYDYMVRTDTVQGPGGGAALIRVKGTTKAMAIATDCNGRLVYLNPKAGAKWAVAEAARNVAITGAKPVAITNCLNFGNPEKPEIYWQFKNAIEGMAEACLALSTPVTGGNVSFYNETEGEAVYPTPVIGMLGVLDDVSKKVTPGFKATGDVIALLGTISGDAVSLAGSEYLETVHGAVAGCPRDPDLALEKSLVDVLVKAASEGLLRSAQDLSEGGLAVALAESCILAEKGADGAVIELGGTGCKAVADHRPDAVLFGECNSAVVVSLVEEDVSRLKEICGELGVPFGVLGKVSGSSSLRIESCMGTAVLDVQVSELRDVWKNGLLRAMAGDTARGTTE